VDTENRPLAPCHPARARRLLTERRAAVCHRYPFTIVLKRSVPEAQPQPLRAKIDPGRRTTGLAMVNDPPGAVVWAADLTHRGQQIRAPVLARRAIRRRRRQRQTRDRQPRVDPRRKPDGWLPPAVARPVQNPLPWVDRWRRYGPLGAISQERVRCDTHLLPTPASSGVASQPRELAGDAVCESLRDPWGRACASCGAEQVPRQSEHLSPKARGGSQRVSTLTRACHPCTERTGTPRAQECGHPDAPGKAQQPRKDAAAVNTARWARDRRVVETGLPVDVGTGGRTKWPRTQRNLPPTHGLDAACLAARSAPRLRAQAVVRLALTATGRESRPLCRVDRFRVARTSSRGARTGQGVPTGDRVRASVTQGIKPGTAVGRGARGAAGSFTIAARGGTVQGIPARSCHVIHQADGESDCEGRGGAASPWLKPGVSAPQS
jgi:hypothetical protein